MSLISVLQSMNFYTDVTSVDIDTNGDGQPDQTISINQISQSEVVSSARNSGQEFRGQEFRGQYT